MSKQYNPYLRRCVFCYATGFFSWKPQTQGSLKLRGTLWNVFWRGFGDATQGNQLHQWHNTPRTHDPPVRQRPTHSTDIRRLATIIPQLGLP